MLNSCKFSFASYGKNKNWEWSNFLGDENLRNGDGASSQQNNNINENYSKGVRKKERESQQKRRVLYGNGCKSPRCINPRFPNRVMVELVIKKKKNKKGRGGPIRKTSCYYYKKCALLL